MIPKIIHQTWKNQDLPDDFKLFHAKIKELHPGWEIKLWTDEENLNLVKNHFPELLEVYQSMKYNIMRADVIRYMYMSVYGGYYMDLDYELIHSLDDLSDCELLLPVSLESKKGKPVIIGNCIFGSVPHHEFWKDVLFDLQQNPPLKNFFNRHDVEKYTGPIFISRIYFKKQNGYNAVLPRRNIFHPDNNVARQNDYVRILQQNGARGIHHCAGSWRGLHTPLEYLSTKTYSILIHLLKKNLKWRV